MGFLGFWLGFVCLSIYLLFFFVLYAALVFAFILLVYGSAFPSLSVTWYLRVVCVFCVWFVVFCWVGFNGAVGLGWLAGLLRLE